MKGGFTMTNILTNESVRDFIFDDTKYESKNSKIKDIQLIYDVKVKQKYKDLINEYVVIDKDVRNGEATIKDTRITTEDIIYIVYESRNQKEQLKYIYEQYPSLTNKKQILAALLYSIKNTNFLKLIIAIIFS